MKDIEEDANGKISVKAGLTLNESTWDFLRIECQSKKVSRAKPWE